VFPARRGPGLLAALIHAVLYVGVVAPLINGIGHWRGAQNFDNTAYNSTVLAWVTGGESLHNNHHAARARRSSACVEPNSIRRGW